MNSSRLLIFILVIVFFCRCEFKPDEVPETVVIPPDVTGPPIVFSLNDLTDTIKIGWKSDFLYEVEGSGNKILSVKVEISGKLLHQYLANNGQTGQD